MEQILLEHISRHKKVVVTGNSLHGYSGGKSCLTNRIAFFDTMTGFLDNMRVMNITDFNKAFDSPPYHSCIQIKMLHSGWVDELG